jgi:hypothetical protein
MAKDSFKVMAPWLFAATRSDSDPSGTGQCQDCSLTDCVRLQKAEMRLYDFEAFYLCKRQRGRVETITHIKYHNLMALSIQDFPGDYPQV